MHNTQLYLENHLIELDETVHFAITKTFEDMTNPTVMINDWSKTIDIPGTSSNNKFFGHIYNPDMQIVSSSTSFSYVNFDPTRKLDMRLVYDGMLLMSGYAKVTQIKHAKGKIYYNCTLNAQMGKIFQELSKIRFDMPTDTSTTEDIKYVIDTSAFFIEKMDVNHMNSLWMTDQLQQGVYDVSDNINPNLRSSDIISFTPNNAYNEDFDYKTFQVNKNHSMTFKETLENYQPSLVSQIPADSIYPNGPKPREIGEYRTYNQLPYIYFNKLFQIVTHKAYELTGYRFRLPFRWFSNNNPYWYKTVLMLQPLQYHNEQLKDDSNSNIYNNIAMFNAMDIEEYSDYAITYESNGYCEGVSGYYETVPIAQWSQTSPLRAYWFNTAANSYPVNLTMKVSVRTYIPDDFDDQTANRTGIAMFDDSGLVIEIEHVDQNGNVVSSNKSIICSENTTLNLANYDNIQKISRWDRDIYPHNFSTGMEISDVFEVSQIDYGSKFGLKFKTYWIGSSTYAGGIKVLRQNRWESPYTYTSEYPVNVTSTSPMTIRFGKEIRSGSDYQLSDLWNFEYSPWQVILNYCKMFRLLVSVDESRHCIEFIPATQFFESYTIEDWTDKLDMNSDFIIKPVYLNSQNVLFNVDNSETQIGKIYNEKYGLNYGEKKIITDYKFDTNTTELFKDIKTCLATTENVLSWTNVYDLGLISFIRPSSEIMIHSHDDENKLVNPFGSLAFWTGNHMWNSPDGNLRNTFLSDDTVLQKSQNTYYYTQGADPSCWLQSNGYQQVNVAYQRNICLFGTPYENYSSQTWNGRTDIYDSFWRKYVDERYNIQTKMVTCYLDIKPLDYLNFRFNKFVKIENNIYFVNKIYDYDIMSEKPTKCDLISVKDLSAYYSDNYQYIDGKPKNDKNQLFVGGQLDLDIVSNGNSEWAIESPGVFDFSTRTGTGNQTITVYAKQNAEPGDYRIMIYRTDSPFSSMTEKEHAYIELTIIPDNE